MKALWQLRRRLLWKLLSLDNALKHAFTSWGAAPANHDLKHFDRQLEKARVAWFQQMRAFETSFGIIWLPPAPMLTEEHLASCRVLPNREAILQRIKAGGIAAEVGVQTGRFSRTILHLCRPSRLHLIDLDLRSFAIGDQFRSEIDAGVVHLHEGDSSTILQGFPDAYFDFIYIDGDHTYDGVKRDIQAARGKVNESGYLLFNDYTYWSPAECMRYGVIQAVNELCLEGDWEPVFFALAPCMYCDVALRRRRKNVEASPSPAVSR
jgi:hypothetical protein